MGQGEKKDLEYHQLGLLSGKSKAMVDASKHQRGSQSVKDAIK